MPCKDFDWKKNWIWIALGVGIFVALVVVVLIVVLIVILGLGGIEEYQTYGLELHNEYRAKHKAPALTLNIKMNDLAVKCAEYYVKEVKGIDHSCPYKKKYGENLASRTASGTLVSSLEAKPMTKMACDGWYDEIKLYDFKKQGFSLATGHFTCMVWKAAKGLGVGLYKSGDFAVVVALYDPHPNVEGQFEENVLPPS